MYAVAVCQNGIKVKSSCYVTFEKTISSLLSVGFRMEDNFSFHQGWKYTTLWYSQVKNGQIHYVSV